MTTTPAMLARVLVLCFTTVRVSSKQVVCPSIDKKKENTKTEYARISGLTTSPTQLAPSGKPVLFGVGDAGSAGEIYLYDSGDPKAERFMKLRVKDVTIDDSDWESVTIGSCGATGIEKTCLYISDAGDNKAREKDGDKSFRDSKYRLIKIEEPLWKDYDDDDKIRADTISVLDFTYRHSSSPTNSADCEAIFLDHVGWGKGGAIGDLYLITKWNSPQSKKWNRLFKFPANAWITHQDELYRPKAVGSYDGGGSFMGITWVGADSSFDGTLVSLVGWTEDAYHGSNYLFLRCPGSTVAEALAAPDGDTEHCLKWKVPVEGKNEAIAWSPDGTQVFNVPEGSNEGIGTTTFNYDPDEATQICPQVAWVEGSSGFKCRTIKGGKRKPDAWCEVADSLAIAADEPNGDQDTEPEEEQQEQEKEEDTAVEEPEKDEKDHEKDDEKEIVKGQTANPWAPEEQQDEATDVELDTLDPPLELVPEDGGEEDEGMLYEYLQAELLEVNNSSAKHSTISWITSVLILAMSIVNLVCQF